MAAMRKYAMERRLLDPAKGQLFGETADERIASVRTFRQVLIQDLQQFDAKHPDWTKRSVLDAWYKQWGVNHNVIRIGRSALGSCKYLHEATNWFEVVTRGAQIHLSADGVATIAGIPAATVDSYACGNGPEKYLEKILVGVPWVLIGIKRDGSFYTVTAYGSSSMTTPQGEEPLRELDTKLRVSPDETLAFERVSEDETHTAEEPIGWYFLGVYVDGLLDCARTQVVNDSLKEEDHFATDGVQVYAGAYQEILVSDLLRMTDEEIQGLTVGMAQSVGAPAPKYTEGFAVYTPDGQFILKHKTLFWKEKFDREAKGVQVSLERARTYNDVQLGCLGLTREHVDACAELPANIWKERVAANFNTSMVWKLHAILEELRAGDFRAVALFDIDGTLIKGTDMAGKPKPYKSLVECAKHFRSQEVLCIVRTGRSEDLLDEKIKRALNSMGFKDQYILGNLFPELEATGPCSTNVSKLLISKAFRNVSGVMPMVAFDDNRGVNKNDAMCGIVAFHANEGHYNWRVPKSLMKGGRTSVSKDLGFEPVMHSEIEETIMPMLEEGGVALGLFGPQGAGKSTMVKYLTARLGKDNVLLRSNDPFAEVEMTDGRIGLVPGLPSWCHKTINGQLICSSRCKHIKIVGKEVVFADKDGEKQFPVIISDHTTIDKKEYQGYGDLTKVALRLYTGTPEECSSVVCMRAHELPSAFVAKCAFDQVARVEKLGDDVRLIDAPRPIETHPTPSVAAGIRLAGEVMSFLATFPGPKLPKPLSVGCDALVFELDGEQRHMTFGRRPERESLYDHVLGHQGSQTVKIAGTYEFSVGEGDDVKTTTAKLVSNHGPVSHVTLAGDNHVLWSVAGNLRDDATLHDLCKELPVGEETVLEVGSLSLRVTPVDHDECEVEALYGFQVAPMGSRKEADRRFVPLRDLVQGDATTIAWTWKADPHSRSSTVSVLEESDLMNLKKVFN